MSMCSPYPITLTADERAEWVALARRSTAAFRLVSRARIVLADAESDSNPGIAAVVGVHVDTAHGWRTALLPVGGGGLAWLQRNRRLARRYERKAEHFQAFADLGCALLTSRRLIKVTN
jgi:hypothetical protein